MKERIKRNFTIGGLIVLLVLAVWVLFIYNRQKDKRIIEYTNLFEYAINMKGEEELYAPAQVEFGMSVEELVQSQESTNVTVRDEDTQRVIYTTQKVADLSETIEEAVFNKIYVVVEEIGLVNVVYQLVVDDADVEEMCMLLYEQAVDYMPEPSNSLENLKQEEMVEWIESEVISENKVIPKSIVRVEFESPYGEEGSKTLISLNIYTTRALRDTLE